MIASQNGNVEIVNSILAHHDVLINMYDKVINNYHFLYIIVLQMKLYNKWNINREKILPF